MSEETRKSCCAEMSERMNPEGRGADACPMSRMCRRAMGKANPGFFLAIPGIALLIVGALILLAPTLLVWFLAGTAILLGLGMLVFAIAVSRSTRFRAA